MRDYKIYLNDILEAIKRIENSAGNVTKKVFMDDADIQDMTIRRIEMIGEAVKNLPEDLKKKYPNIEWKKIAGIRDIITHAYFKVNLEIIWDIVKNKLPNLKKEILEILNS